MLNLLLAYVLTGVLVQQAQTYLIAAELRPAKRPLKLWLLQTALVTAIFIIALLISYRPYLSGIITLAVCAIFLVVNQAKYKALAEPLVFSDIYLYLQVFSHPRLFLPFLNLPLTMIAVITGLGLLYTAATLEFALNLPRLSFSLTLIDILALLAAIILKVPLGIKLYFEPKIDIKNLGFFNNLFIYFLQAKQKNNITELSLAINKQSPYTKTTKETVVKPDLIVIQSESFFDARTLSKSVQTNVLQYFDVTKLNSIQNGKLTVPAWGANTLRTEYAFLSSIDNHKLKYYRYNPYQFLQTATSPSIANYLRNLGYRCVCVHPNHSIFFKRNKVFPLLGFDEFIDINEFDPRQTTGPYISDQAVATKIQTLLSKTEDPRPLFIFAITMENHGPLHLEDYAKSDLEQLYQATPPKQHHDLTIYLKHLKNADQMLGNLTNYLQSRSTESLLCWYGDHVPSMPTVYKELNFQDGRSDYLLWSNRTATIPAKQKDLAIEQLGTELLALAGVRITDES